MIVLEMLQKVVLACLALKILWNLLLPYSLFWQLVKTKEERTQAVSVMPFLELILGCVVVVLALIIPGGGWNQNAGTLLMIVSLAVVGSIIHFFIIGFIGGALASFLGKHQN